ncbi:hypothetical protein AJ78_08647 [Emergomyces pasteurianus Ep9510]|uniref:ABC transporter domain-containing protein n=1 Tax=Emergomyces pasteurianus Ep9510 TaxID=1447872 RepID=A0A1J9P342_9EURO|nr:hypothetical protein AJ78_08647 [Emergomyces pasteurianus Ep9510]
MSDLLNAERLLDLFMISFTVTDKENAADLDLIESIMKFKNVNFTYNSKRVAIRDVSIFSSLEETIVLVGITGAEKSSLMKLLLCFYDVTSSSIKINDHDIHDITQGSL